MNRNVLTPLLAVVVCGAALFMTSAAAPKSNQIAMGYVDLRTVFEDAPVAQAAKRSAEEMRGQLQRELSLMQDTVALSDEEQKELRTLLAKQNPSDKEKARIAELRGKTAKLDDELVQLQQKPAPTDAEKARMQELTQLFSRARNKLQQEMQARQDRLDQEGDKLMAGLQEKILKAVEDVAREQGLTMVVDKQARLFGGEDITKAVVGKLKK
jgi:Skp family chaperone for outer membrane proteins